MNSWVQELHEMDQPQKWAWYIAISSTTPLQHQYTDKCDKAYKHVQSFYGSIRLPPFSRSPSGVNIRQHENYIQTLWHHDKLSQNYENMTYIGHASIKAYESWYPLGDVNDNTNMPIISPFSNGINLKLTSLTKILNMTAQKTLSPFVINGNGKTLWGSITMPSPN